MATRDLRKQVLRYLMKIQSFSQKIALSRTISEISIGITLMSLRTPGQRNSCARSSNKFKSIKRRVLTVGWGGWWPTGKRPKISTIRHNRPSSGTTPPPYSNNWTSFQTYSALIQQVKRRHYLKRVRMRRRGLLNRARRLSEKRIRLLSKDRSLRSSRINKSA